MKHSNKKLLKMLANARTTSASAGGHTKAALNEINVNENIIVLSERGVEIPEDEELYKTGRFNGVGSV